MKITGLSHLFKWENLHNWWLTKYFLPHCIYYVYIEVLIHLAHHLCLSEQVHIVVVRLACKHAK